MATYAIKDLERISGIKAHTLRIWEKRFALFQPKRTETNIRYYDGEDLRKVLNIAILKRHGIKISHIVDLSPEEIAARVLEITQSESSEEVQIENLLISMLELDELRFEKVIANCNLRLGFKETMLKVIYPFILRVGVLWQAGTAHIGQEHFISGLIRRKLIVAIDHEGMVKQLSGSKNFLLFLPEGELHELGILFYNYLIRRAGHRSVYLGQSTPIEDAELIHQQVPCNYVVTSVVSSGDQAAVEEILNKILNTFPNVEVILTNRIDFVPEVENRKRLHVNLSVEAFDEMLHA